MNFCIAKNSNSAGMANSQQSILLIESVHLEPNCYQNKLTVPSNHCALRLNGQTLCFSFYMPCLVVETMYGMLVSYKGYPVDWGARENQQGLGRLGSINSALTMRDKHLLGGKTHYGILGDIRS